MKNHLISISLILVLFILAANLNWRVRDKLLELQYDFLHENKAINTKHEIQKQLAALEQISFQKLDEAYLSYTKSDNKKYEKLVNGLTYYKIKRTQLNQKIVGHFRWKAFICKDDYYQECIFDQREEVIGVFNPKIFFKTLELIEELDKLDYDKYGFRIVNGHRHPRYNEKIKGAQFSRHIKGEAVDIVVDDINEDGRANKKDKDIVLDLLEKKIIGNEGGIGLYPGTDNVHYDVRGTRARWNSY